MYESSLVVDEMTSEETAARMQGNQPDLERPLSLTPDRVHRRRAVAIRQGAEGQYRRTSPRLDAGLLRELLHDETTAVRSAALQNPAASAEDRARAKAARERAWRESAPSRTQLEQMIANTRAEVRIQVALDRRSPPDALALLGGERRSAQVRRAVAANPSTPPSVLESLAVDNDAQVRQAVAFNGVTHTEVLADLAARSLDLALIVALNPDAPIEVIDALVADGDQLVSFIAAGARTARFASIGTGAKAASGATAAFERAALPSKANVQRALDL